MLIHLPGYACTPHPHSNTVNCWPMIAGTNSTSARQQFPLGGGHDSGARGLISGRWKLVLGSSVGVGMSGYTGSRYPNASSAAINWAATKTNCTQGCLFDLKADPNEHAELVSGSSGNATAAAAAKAKVHDLTAELLAIEQTAWAPNRGQRSKAACAAAQGRYSGTYGPFVG